MSMMTIKVKIGDKIYSLNLNSEQEEIWRRAEKEVNSLMVKWQHAGFENFDKTDSLAMVALQLSANNIETKLARSVGDTQMEQLATMDRELEHYLNKIKR